MVNRIYRHDVSIIYNYASKCYDVTSKFEHIDGRMIKYHKLETILSLWIKVS
jgi:hypothetical protein